MRVVKKQRFFKEQLKLPLNKPATQDSLFVEEDEGGVVDIEKELFASELFSTLGHLPVDTINSLYQQHQDEPDAAKSAIRAYLGSERGKKRTAEEDTPETTENTQRSQTMGRGPKIANSQVRQNGPTELTDEIADLQERMHTESIKIKQELEANQWQRFIGSVPVQAWTTKPTMKPFQYGEVLTLKRLVPKNSSIGETSIIRLFNSSDREIARIPENLTRIFTPLIDLEMADFSTTVLESTKLRLSTGDSFFIQINIFLKSTAFKPVTSEDDYSLKKFKGNSKKSATKSNFNFSSETNNEVILRMRQFALAKLFETLSLRPTRTLDEAEVEDVPVEEVDVSDDDIVPAAVKSEVSTEEGDDGLKPVDHVDLDQLKQFYQANNHSNLLNNLPEDTEPPQENFKVGLRAYQRHGLSWMLTREREIDRLRELNKETDLSSQSVRIIEEQNAGTVNPLWKRYQWPKNPADPLSQETKYFYANTFNGELSLEKPISKNTLLGGVIADEMGLGKTISALALVNSVPYDLDPVPSSKRPYASKSTLIVVPMSLLTQWKKEFDKCNNNPKHFCHIYYGDATDHDLEDLLVLLRPDIPIVVLTTYGTVVNEYGRLSKQRDLRGEMPAMGIYGVEFFRIILDEGHNIRNRNTKSAKSIYELMLKRKWVLTGTPIINRLDDLYSLIKFLKLEPWCNFSYWKTFVTLPFEQKRISQTLEIIKSILDPIFLRRTKNMKQSDGTPIVQLPPKEVIVEEVEFNEREEKLYDWFKSKATQTFKEGVQSGQLLKQYTQILTHILRLRQICCHIDLVGGHSQMDEDEDLKMEQLDQKTAEELEALISHRKTLGFADETELKRVMYPLYSKIDLKEDECSICTASPINFGEMVVTPCGHSYCFTCLLDHIEFQTNKNAQVLCPNCRAPVSKYKLFKLRSKETTRNEIRFHTQNEDPSENYKFQLYWYDPDKTSSKLEALKRHLRALRQSNPGEKVILFSQFSSYLDIIENELKSQGSGEFEVYKFDGRLQLGERQKILDKFNAEPKDRSNIVVLLLSLKAGGVGLNLTTASRAFMMDPWWSPSVEDQAIDRIHRIGQNETVKVVRFIVKNSIEINMLKIQERKKQIGEAVGAQEEERRKRRIEEIQMLFQD